MGMLRGLPNSVVSGFSELLHGSAIDGHGTSEGSREMSGISRLEVGCEYVRLSESPLSVLAFLD